MELDLGKPEIRIYWKCVRAADHVARAAVLYSVLGAEGDGRAAAKGIEAFAEDHRCYVIATIRSISPEAIVPKWHPRTTTCAK